MCSGNMTRSDEATPSECAFLHDVLDGLSAPNKFIPGKYLWDEKGSSLFDEICGSDAYYPTKREMALLKQGLQEVADIVGPNACLVEAGSGASHKIRILLDALAKPKRYIAIDISREFLSAAAQRIRDDYPGLEVLEVCADYSLPLPALPILRLGEVVGLFLGISIANIDRASAVLLLSRLREALGQSCLLIGQDPNDDANTLSNAYGGPLMAEFHKNLLARMSRELGAKIIVEDFEHEARIVETPKRMEAHLVAKRPTVISLGTRHFVVAAGESIRTDISRKYTQAEFLALLAEAGWAPIRSWADKDNLFALHLLRAAP